MTEALADFDDDMTGLPPVPDAPEVLAPLRANSMILIEHKEYRPAMNLLRNYLMRKPNDPWALRSLGECLRELGSWEDACRCFQALSKLERTAENKLLLADCLYLLGSDERARKIYEEVLIGLTDSHQALFGIYKNLGNILVRSGDFDGAEEWYNKAFTIEPRSDVLMVNYGTLELHREDLNSAIDRFRQAVEINSENDKAWVGLAIVHRNMGDLALSVANLERALDINPKNKTALHLLAEWNLKDGDLTPSICRLKTYLEFEGEDAEMSFLLARIFTHTNRLFEARLEMERTLALDPEIEGGSALLSALQNEIVRRGQEL